MVALDAGSRAGTLERVAVRTSALLNSRTIFWVLIAASAVFRCWLGLRGHAIRHPDEIFQTIEQAHRLVFGYGIEPWEFKEGIRWLGTPALLALPMMVAKLLGVGSTFYIPVIRLTLAVYSLMPFPAFYKLVRRKFSGALALLACLVPLLWPENLDFVGSTLSDALVAPLLAWTVIETLSLAANSRLRAAALASCLVLAFCIRFEVAPALALLGIVALWRLRWAGRFWLLGGIVASAALVAVLDLSLGQVPFREFYLNILRNMGDGVAAGYGTKPVQAYLDWIGQHWGSALLLAAVLAVCDLKRTWLYLLVATAVLGPLLLIGHKEYRFYYPATLTFTFAVGTALASFGSRYGLAGKPAGKLAGIVALIAVLGPQVTGYLDLAAQAEDLRVVAQTEAARQPDLCGLANSYGMSVVGTAGLAYLNRDVPFAAVGFSGPDDPNLGHFNYVIADREAGKKLIAAYSEEQCWDGRFKGGLCLYRRDGGCAPGADTSQVPPPGK